MLNYLEGLFCMLSNEITVLVMRWKQSQSEPWHQSHTSPLSFAWHTCRSSVRLPVAAFVFGSRVCVKTLSSYLSGLWFCWLHGQHEIAPTLPLWDSAADKMSSEEQNLGKCLNLPKTELSTFDYVVLLLLVQKNAVEHWIEHQEADNYNNPNTGNHDHSWKSGVWLHDDLKCKVMADKSSKFIKISKISTETRLHST